MDESARLPVGKMQASSTEHHRPLVQKERMAGKHEAFAPPPWKRRNDSLMGALALVDLVCDVWAGSGMVLLRLAHTIDAHD